MELDLSQLAIKNNPDESRFEAQIGEHLAMAEYNIAGNNIIFTHTEVPPALEGYGVGSKIAHYALEWAKNEGYKVQPLCPFIRHYVEEHPEYQAISWGFKRAKK